LRDRWDASIAGAAGLHPDARTRTSATSEGTRLTLTWESMEDDVPSDPLILAATRSLAIWLREDENENLRNESAGLMDMFVELYRESSAEAVDFRFPILTALESVMTTEDGVDNFLNQNGWSILSGDLFSIQPSISSGMQRIAQTASRGIEVIRVLLSVIDHESTIEPREDWMDIVKVTASMNPDGGLQDPVITEFQVAMLQISAALLTKAGSGMQKRYAPSVPAIIGLAKTLRTRVERDLTGPVADDLSESIDDVVMGLDNLR